MDYIKHPLEDTLVYEQSLPVAWEPFSLTADPGFIASCNRSNENLLKVLLSLDDPGKEHDDSGREVSHELQRIEAKVDLLLQWLGKWVASTQGIPPEAPVCLSEAGVKLALPPSAAASAIDVGDGLLFHVYLDRHYPQALQLPCEVYSVEHQGDASVVIGSFSGLHADVSDLIEKFIFREHRRKIAASKRSPS